jgi:hypothetical protein
MNFKAESSNASLAFGSEPFWVWVQSNHSTIGFGTEEKWIWLLIFLSSPDVVGALIPTVAVTLVNAVSTLRIAKSPTLTHKAFAINNRCRVGFLPFDTISQTNAFHFHKHSKGSNRKNIKQISLNHYTVFVFRWLCTNWYGVALAIVILAVMIAAGYYLFRSWMRDYTYDTQPKTWIS